MKTLLYRKKNSIGNGRQLPYKMKFHELPLDGQLCVSPIDFSTFLDEYGTIGT